MLHDRSHLDRERREFEPLAAELRIAGAKRDLRPGSCFCPFHDNTQSPSGSIHQKDGIWRFKCFSCGAKGDVFTLRAKNRRCSIKDVLREARQNASPASNRLIQMKSSPPTTKPVKGSKPPESWSTSRECFDEIAVRSRRHGGWELAHVYLYEREAGQPVGASLRFERNKIDPETRQVSREKTVRMAHRGEDGRWTNQALPAPRPAYREPEIRAAIKAGKPILVVEGEKTVAALVAAGYEATTNMGGANAVRHTDWAALGDAEEVVIWRDADEAGVKHAAEVIRQLEALPNPPQKVRIVDVSDMPEGHDAADVTPEEMRRRIDGATLYELKKSQPQDDRCIPSGVAIRRASDIEAKPIRWLWKPYLAFGMGFAWAGPAGLGKTFAVIDLVARISRGLPMPFEKAARPPRSVLIWAEDSPEYVTIPRLKAAGADLTKVHILDGKRVLTAEGKEQVQPLTLADLAMLKEAVRATGDTGLLVIDPVNAYFGEADTHKQSEVAALLTPFTAMATELDIAVLFVHHFNKNDSGRGEHRMSGSVAFRSAVRGVSYVTKDKNDDSLRWLAVSKNNVGIDRGGAAYELVASSVPDIMRVEWIRQDPGMNGNDNASDADVEDGGSILDNALHEAILTSEKGELDFGALKAIGERTGGYGKAAVRASLARLGAISCKVGFGKGSHTAWRLPPKQSTPVLVPETMESLERMDSLSPQTDMASATPEGEVAL